MSKHFYPARQLLLPLRVFAVLLFPIAVNAVDFDTYEEANQFKDDVQKEVWLEQAVPLPEYPDSSDLIELPVQLTTAALTILVDVDAVEAGDDGVVRYTMALRSPTGAENIFYEGVRCSTKEWKTYAYGSSQGKWRIHETDWGILYNMGIGRYRYSLYEGFLCEPSGKHLATSEIQRRLRYGRKGYDDN